MLRDVDWKTVIVTSAILLVVLPLTMNMIKKAAS